MSPSTTRGICKAWVLFFCHLFLLSNTRGKQPYVRRLADDHDALTTVLRCYSFSIAILAGCMECFGTFFLVDLSEFFFFSFLSYCYALLLVDCFAYCIFFHILKPWITLSCASVAPPIQAQHSIDTELLELPHGLCHDF